MNSATYLCDMLEIEIDVHPPEEVYYQGWGQECSHPRIVKCSWGLNTMETSQPVRIKLDLTDGDSPLILCIYFLQFSDPCNRQDPRVVRFKRPGDDDMRTMFTYISPDRNGNDRLRLEVVAYVNSLYRSLLAAHLQHDSLAVATKIPFFSHAHADDIKSILRDAGRLDADTSRACDKVAESCPICASTGRPAQHRKVSLTHVSSAFNQELQADFTIVSIQGGKHEILNLCDAGTRYGERSIARTRSADVIKEIF